MKIIGAVDIGGTKIAVGAATLEGQILRRIECPAQPEAGFLAAMTHVKSMLRDLSANAADTMIGVGVACPGPLDPITGVIGDVGTLPGWQGGNLKAELASEFAVPIAVENDADAAALAEAQCGAGKGSSSLIYVTISTGIGVGIVLDGRLLRGRRGAHPEIGHMVIDASCGSCCYCQASGCWESLASGEAIANWVRQQHPLPVPRTAAEICSLAELGDPLALKAMEREGHYLGLGLANLITLFIPETIVLGGGVMKSAHLFLPRALATVRATATQVPAYETSILPAALGADAGLAGAALAWLSHYAPTPARTQPPISIP